MSNKSNENNNKNLIVEKLIEIKIVWSSSMTYSHPYFRRPIWFPEPAEAAAPENPALHCGPTKLAEMAWACDWEFEDE